MIWTLDCVQTIPNDEGTDIHLDYLNDTKIWADWVACIVRQGKRGLIFTNTDRFNNNNGWEQVYLICTRLTSSVHSKLLTHFFLQPTRNRSAWSALPRLPWCLPRLWPTRLSRNAASSFSIWRISILASFGHLADLVQRRASVEFFSLQIHLADFFYT